MLFNYQLPFAPFYSSNKFIITIHSLYYRPRFSRSPGLPSQLRTFAPPSADCPNMVKYLRYHVVKRKGGKGKRFYIAETRNVRDENSMNIKHFTILPFATFSGFSGSRPKDERAFILWLNHTANTFGDILRIKLGEELGVDGLTQSWDPEQLRKTTLPADLHFLVNILNPRPYRYHNSHNLLCGPDTQVRNSALDCEGSALP
jgi:hypothetical protein